MNETIDIRKIHPDLEPIDTPPSLFSFYGFGTRLYGDRDYSEESRSSIKTLFITLFYVPVFPLKAYRVVKDSGRYYFLGRVPVSKMARNGSLAALLTGILAVTGFGIQQHVTSDKFINGKVLAEAEAAAGKGELANAMALYKQLFNNSDYYKKKATNNIATLASVRTLKNASNEEFAKTLEVFNSFLVSPLANMPEGVYDLALDRIKDGDVKNNTVSHNIGVHRLLHAAEGLNAKGEDLSGTDMELARLINDADPANLEAAVEISEIYFAEEKYAEVKNVLAPVRGRLDDTEAARILGQIYLSEGNNAEAYPLLSAYTSGRLKILQGIEKAFTDLQNRLWEGEINILSAGLAPQSFYDAYDKKSETEQQLFVDEYIGEKINNDPAYQASLNEYSEAAAIVPVVMDFGILQLRTAETMTSEQTRNTELKAAEETFLSIKNIVGDTDEYKIYLGQVYFWLGKQDEGQALFDEILNANSRSANSLLSIAGTLRSLGKVGLAAELAQEAYDSAKDDEARYNAASVMSLLSIDIEDKISWLKRSDPKSVFIQASLKESQGHLAAQKGDAKAAARFYRQAIKYSESQAEDATNYNNTALSYFALHQVTGDKTAYRKGVELMSKAVELRPDESILLSNAASTLVINSLYETIGDDIDYKHLQSRPSLSSIGYYYSNSVEKDVLRKKIRGHQDLQKAIDYLERSILLSPNSVQNYNTLYNILYFLDDQKAVSDLADKMSNSQIDITEINTAFIDYITGVDAAENLVKLKDQESHYMDLLSGGTKPNKATKGVLHILLADNLLEQAKEANGIAAAKKAVAHAEKAVSNLPSTASRTSLNNALLTLASVEAAKQYPEYQALRTKSVRSLSDTSLVILMLGRKDEIANWLKSNANIQRAINIEIVEYKNFPETTALDSWALLKVGNPEIAAKIGAKIRQSDLRKSMQRIAGLTFPLAGGTVARHHWMNKLSGKPAIEASKFEELEQQGVGLPRQLFQ